MTRRFEDDELVIASHNQGKVEEIGELLAPFGVRARSAASHSLPEPEETGHTFVATWLGCFLGLTMLAHRRGSLG